MKPIKDLFAVYQQRLKPPQASVEKVVKEEVVALFGWKVSDEQISYTVATKTVHIHLPSVLKSELRLQKSTLQVRIHKRLGGSAPKEIL